MCTAPLTALTVTGNAAALAGWLVAPPLALVPELPHAAHATAMTAAAARAGRRLARTRIIILRRFMEDEARPLRHRRGIEAIRPSSEDRSLTRARRPGSSPQKGHHRCGTAPGSHRLRWAQRHPGQTQDRRTLPQKQLAGAPHNDGRAPRPGPLSSARSSAGGRTALAMTRAAWLRRGTSERRPAPPATTRSAGGS